MQRYRRTYLIGIVANASRLHPTQIHIAAEYNGIVMAEEEGKKNEKFDFTPQAEAVGFVTLDQARLIAIQRAQEESGNYGPSWQSVPMVFEVVDAEETEDDYSLSLSFHPEGEFTGTPGRKSLLGGVARRLSAQGFRHGRRRKEGLLSV